MPAYVRDRTEIERLGEYVKSTGRYLLFFERVYPDEGKLGLHRIFHVPPCRSRDTKNKGTLEPDTLRPLREAASGRANQTEEGESMTFDLDAFWPRQVWDDSRPIEAEAGLLSQGSSADSIFYLRTGRANHRVRMKGKGTIALSRWGIRWGGVDGERGGCNGHCHAYPLYGAQ